MYKVIIWWESNKTSALRQLMCAKVVGPQGHYKADLLDNARLHSATVFQNRSVDCIALYLNKALETRYLIDTVQRLLN